MPLVGQSDAMLMTCFQSTNINISSPDAYSEGLSTLKHVSFPQKKKGKKVLLF